ncbi:Glycosyl transferase family 2 [Roseivivax lentus]|uniref:Glycosyl transferase family 2 n=1 Tax=Roseivivax lentus TaxID=633194 RepID=A0A1N7MYS2_9RHOB|nr:glycosyltransferase family 2 protein [Roseivivax lentus]SIS91091.1 Glycosyl transferase family 2 [Roseivivax lentus]
MNILAILCVRNEAAYLLDWLAHAQAAGIGHVLAYSNDCEDGTDAMLDRMAALGHVTHRPNPGPYDKGGIQFTALKDAAKQPVTRAADWILPLDVDEFVNVHVGDRTLPALIAALPEAQAITLTWRLFGCGGQVRYDPAPVPERFTRAAPQVMHWPWRAAMFKTLYRNDGTYRKPGVHRPRDPRPARAEAARWFDGSGRELDAQFRTRRIFSNFGQDNGAMAQLNHYPLGSMEEYVLKAARGRAVHSDHLLGLDYWVERNFNIEEDRSIAPLTARAAVHRAAFAADPTLAALHDDAVAWRRARFDSLMLEEPYRALMGRLMTTPGSRPLDQDAAQFLKSYGLRAAQSADT